MDSASIKAAAGAMGAEVCGIAGVERFTNAPKGFHPVDIFPKAGSVIVFGLQFPRSVFDAATNCPYTLARNWLLGRIDDIAVRLTFELESKGHAAVPIPSSEPYEYWDTKRRHGRGILSLKHAAELAGIGRLGKNTLLINERYGNRLWLGAVITDAALAQDPPARDLCPRDCRICLDACPQAALDGVSIDQKKCREICASSSEGGGAIYACNICRKACPQVRV